MGSFCMASVSFVVGVRKLSLGEDLFALVTSNLSSFVDICDVNKGW